MIHSDSFVLLSVSWTLVVYTFLVFEDPNTAGNCWKFHCRCLATVKGKIWCRMYRTGRLKLSSNLRIWIWSSGWEQTRSNNFKFKFKFSYKILDSTSSADEAGEFIRMGWDLFFLPWKWSDCLSREHNVLYGHLTQSYFLLCSWISGRSEIFKSL